jgi:hypothetical protein
MFSALAYAHRPDMAVDLNAWTLAFARATPGCLPSATFYPEPGVAGYVRDALDAGARIFKIHLQVGGFSPVDPQLDEVWGLLASAGVPVVVHAGHAPAGTEHTGPGPFGSVLARHPGLSAIIAHMGAPDYEAFLGLAARYKRVAVDTTMIFTDFFDSMAPFPASALPLARDLGLAGKVLLGSDFPNIPYPYARQVSGLARLGLGDEWLRAVCWENPVALFGRPLPSLQIRCRLFRPGWLPGAGWRAVAADDLPAGAPHLAGAVRVDGELPAHLVQHHVMMPPAVLFQARQARVPAVLAVHHMVGFAAGGRLVAAAGELARLVPQGDKAAQVERDVVGLADVERERGAVQALAEQTSDAVKVSSCLAVFLRDVGEGDGLVVVLAGGQAFPEAAEQAAEQVALGGSVPVAGVFAPVVVGAGAG